MLLTIQYRFYLKTYFKGAEIHIMIHSGTDTVSVLQHKSYLDFTDPHDRGSKLLRSQNFESRTSSHCLIFGTLPQTWDFVRHCGPTREHDNVHTGNSKHLRCDKSEINDNLYLKVINI